jgi:hypothetical protein
MGEREEIYNHAIRWYTIDCGVGLMSQEKKIESKPPKHERVMTLKTKKSTFVGVGRERTGFRGAF